MGWNKRRVRWVAPIVALSVAAGVSMFRSDEPRREQVSGVSIDSLLARYSSLPANDQRVIFERVASRVDEESGLGAVYRSIIAEVRPAIVDASSIGRTAFAGDLSAMVSRLDPNWYALYSAHGDVVVVGDVDCSEAMRILLRSGLSSQGVLAHEALHKVQNDASHVPRILQFLSARGYIQSVDTSQLALSVDPCGLQEIADMTGARSAQEVESKVRRSFLAVPTIDESQALYEVGARCLVPKAQRAQGGVNFTMVSGGSNYNFTLAHSASALPLVVRAYGLACARGGNVDIGANHLIGEYGDSFSILANEVGSDVGAFRAGSNFLLMRAQQGERARCLAQRLLEEEVGAD